MEKNRLGFNIPEQPNQGDHYVTITSCGVDHDWEDDPFGEKEPVEQAPIATDLQYSPEDESPDDRKD